jgi:formate dehydrogenase
LRVSPADADRFGLVAGERAKVTTKRGSAVAVVEVTDVMRDGHISLPNGLGLGRDGDPSDAVGVAPNELTSSDDRDWFAGTPLHKHVRARVEPARPVPGDPSAPTVATVESVGAVGAS